MGDLHNYIRNNKSKLLPIVILVFLSIATIITLYVSQQKTRTTPKAANYTATLSFSPTTLNVVPGQLFSQPITVILNPNGQSVVGADILVCFDRNKLTLTNITKETDPIFQTYAPVDTNGNFDTTKVISNSNNNNVICGNVNGVVEFGIVSFNWSGNVLTTPDAHIVSPVTRLTFQAKAGVTGSTTISFNYISQGTTTDSNVVVNPTSGTNPEDILAQPTSTVTVNFLTASPTATPRPSVSPTATPRPSVSPTATPRPSPSVTPTPRPSPSVTPTPRPSATATPFATPSTTPTTASLALNIKFEGVSSQKADKIVKITLKSGTTTVYSQNITMTASSIGVYSNQGNYITGLTPGTYDVFVKGPVHLTRKFTNQTLVLGNNILNFTSNNQLLLAGDSVGNNRVDIFDYTDLVTYYKCSNAPQATPPIGKSCASYAYLSDFNFDGLINISDYNYMIGNFDVSGD